MAREINLIKSDLGNARAAVTRLQDELRRAQIEGSGVALGDVVISPKYGEVRVARIEPQSWGAIWLRVNPKKKDGTFGTREVRLVSWTAA